MLGWLLHLPIQRAYVVLPVYMVAALAGAYLLCWPLRRHRDGRHVASSVDEHVHRTRTPRWRRTLGAALVGAAAGEAACWLVGDVWDAFGIGLTATTRAWVAAAFAGLAVAIVNLVGTRWWRVVVAAAAIPTFLVAAALGINIDFGAYPTPADALGISAYHTLAIPHGRGGRVTTSAAPSPTSPAPVPLRGWRADGPLPAHGKIGQVSIPATVSHFHARPALVYLPPAALVRNAPRLPVIIALSGQPGKPQNMFATARMPNVLNKYAAAHHGLAPIIVVPDQLGAPDRNPMCVDSPLGRSATYLSVDVPNWIRTHLHATDPGRTWAIAGFSEGGTCSIQLGAGFPHLFDTILDISGEAVPTVGADTVKVAFGGSRVRYDAAKPVNVLAAHRPYPDTVAIFAVGQDDAKYTARMHIIERAAKAAGMRTSQIISPGTAHDWNTVRYVMHHGLPRVADRLLDVP